MVPGGTWNIRGNHSVKYIIGHYAIHLKLIQNSVECKLWLKNKVIKMVNFVCISPQLKLLKYRKLLRR